MTKNEFKNIKIGEKVVITNHGRNKNKMGIVREIKSDEDGPCIVYLEPIDCIFEFSNDYSKWENKNGLYGWNSYGISYPKKPINKKFYALGTYNQGGVSWSADNFKPRELNVIDRFLKEFNEYTGGLIITGISILDD